MNSKQSKGSENPKKPNENRKKRKSQVDESKNLILNISSQLLNSFCGCKIRDAVDKYGYEINLMRNVDDKWKSSVTWTRRVRFPDDFDCDFMNEKLEPFLVIVLKAEEFVSLIKQNQLLSLITSSQQNQNSITSTTLFVQGIRNFCKTNKNAIGMKEIEIHLTQIQLIANCCHRLLETPEDVGLSLATMSKSIADEPLKSKQNEKFSSEQLLFNSDIKYEARKEDKLSLSNLWQKQISTLGPKVSFEVAESVRKKFPFPRNLFIAYDENSTTSLADCTLIQSNGMMVKDRKRIGPALDRKLKNYMTSYDENEILQ